MLSKEDLKKMPIIDAGRGEIDSCLGDLTMVVGDTANDFQLENREALARILSDGHLLTDFGEAAQIYAYTLARYQVGEIPLAELQEQHAVFEQAVQAHPQKQLALQAAAAVEARTERLLEEVSPMSFARAH